MNVDEQTEMKTGYEAKGVAKNKSIKMKNQRLI